MSCGPRKCAPRAAWVAHRVVRSDSAFFALTLMGGPPMLGSLGGWSVPFLPSVAFCLLPCARPYFAHFELFYATRIPPAAPRPAPLHPAPISPLARCSALVSSVEAAQLNAIWMRQVRRSSYSIKQRRDPRWHSCVFACLYATDSLLARRAQLGK